MSIADSLSSTPVSSLDLSRYASVDEDATVAETVDAMREAGRSCACILDGGTLKGVFTQRDVLMRVIGRPSTWQRPIAEEMTGSVRTMLDTQSASDGLAIMNEWWVRSVPVLDEGSQFVGNLSFYTMIRTIGGMLASQVGEKSRGISADEGLTFVDFTGLHWSTPVTVGLDDTVETAAHHMKARGIGSVLVTDVREQLVGVVSEFDLLTEIGCDRSDLSNITVKEVMTADPVVVAARSPIALAIERIIEHEFSHVPLVGETGRPVGVASFRDIAAYVESSLAALG
ncbi:MAG: CBS domain-containing protein [Acidimicrobiia bacterium]|nr:CBS domain-containing protein [Acidimicrobiia bacterium]